eukprot:652048-Amphidinium_carterae.1
MMRELCVLLLHLPLMQINLRAPVPSTVLATDASPTGGGVCEAIDVTEEGRSHLLNEIRSLHGYGRDRLVLLAAGDELGRARRALESLGIEVTVFIHWSRTVWSTATVTHAWPDCVTADSWEQVRCVWKGQQWRSVHIDTLLLVAPPGHQLWQVDFRSDVDCTWPCQIVCLKENCLSEQALRAVSSPPDCEEQLGYRRDHTLHLCSSRVRKGRESMVHDWRCWVLAHALPVGDCLYTVWSSLQHAIGLPAFRSAQTWEDAARRVLGITNASDKQQWVQAIVSGLFRKATHKGSDVRLSTNTLMKPHIFPRQSLSAAHFSWKVRLSFELGGQHINVLELRAADAGVRYYLRSRDRLGSRCLLALDSQVCLGVLVKGRSSSRQLNHVLRLYNCSVLLGHLLMFYVYVATNQNPADRPSRWRE